MKYLKEIDKPVLFHVTLTPYKNDIEPKVLRKDKIIGIMITPGVISAGSSNDTVRLIRGKNTIFDTAVPQITAKITAKIYIICI